jgi:hypothetical protein
MGGNWIKTLLFRVVQTSHFVRCNRSILRNDYSLRYLDKGSLTQNLTERTCNLDRALSRMARFLQEKSIPWRCWDTLSLPLTLQRTHPATIWILQMSMVQCRLGLRIEQLERGPQIQDSIQLRNSVSVSIQNHIRVSWIFHEIQYK